MKFLFLGDVALVGFYESRRTSFFSDDVQSLTMEADFVVANLEVVITSRLSTNILSSVHLRSSLNAIEQLKRLRVNAVNLANNHSFDFGLDGLRDTIRILEANEIDWFGIGGKTLDVNNGDSIYRLHGLCSYETNGNFYGNKGIDVLSHHSFRSRLIRDKLDNVYSIFNCHWGIEHSHYPTLRQRRFLQNYRNYSFTLIGHHSHTIQPKESIDNAHIYYSLGNFCFNDVDALKTRNFRIKMTERNRKGIIVGLKFDNARIIFEEKGIYISDNEVSLSQSSIELFNSLNLDLHTFSYDKIESLRLNEFSSEFRQKFKDRWTLPWILSRLNRNAIGFKFLTYINRVRSRVAGI